MANKSGLYGLVQFGWVLAVAGTVVVILSGNAEPYVSASQLPRPLYLTGVLAVGAVVAGLLVVSYLENRSWRTAGEAAGLAAESASALSAVGIGPKPDLTGTVGGRDVRVRTEARRTGQQSEGDSKQTTYTVVETDLAASAERGAIVTRQPGDGAGPDRADVGNVSVRNVAVDDEFTTVDGAEDLARSVVSGAGRSDLLALEAGTMVLVGDAVGTLQDAVPEMPQDTMLGGMVDAGLSKAFPADPTTVAIQTRGLVLDGATLDRQVAGVVAAADGYEDAAGGGARDAASAAGTRGGDQ